jgi:outer membrane protein assembly factor BamB
MFMIYRIALMLTLALGSFAEAVDWPFYRGPNQDGTTSESNWQAKWPDQSPLILWRKQVGVGASGVVTQGDRAVTMGNADNRDVVVCLDAATGETRWAFDYASEYEERMFEGGTASTPTINNDRVITLSYQGLVHCLSLDTGRLIWRRHLVEDFGGRPARWKYSGSPLVVGGMVIFDTGARRSSTLALDEGTGDKIWASGSDDAGYSTPIPLRREGAEAAVLVFKAEHLVAHRLGDGKELWRIPWETSYDVNASSPVVRGNQVLVSSGYPSGRTALFDVSGPKPRQLWRNDDLKTKMNSSVIYGDRVFGISEKKAVLLCLDADTGRSVWEERGFGQFGTLIVAGSHIVALTEQGELVIAEADPDRYIETARAKVLNGRTWVTPTLSQGRIFCKDNSGNLVCVGVGLEK